MHDLGVSSDPLPTVPALSLGARVLTAPELVGALSPSKAPPGGSLGG